MIGSYALLTAIMTFAFLLGNAPIAAVPFAIMGLFIASLNYESSMIRRFAGVVCIFLCSTAIEFFAIFFVARRVIDIVTVQMPYILKVIGQRLFLGY